jgi:hypothetical protein
MFERTARVIFKERGKKYYKTKLIIHDDTERYLKQHEYNKDEENYFINFFFLRKNLLYESEDQNYYLCLV